MIFFAFSADFANSAVKSFLFCLIGNNRASKEHSVDQQSGSPGTPMKAKKVKPKAASKGRPSS